MGTWGAGSFDNDQATDFVHQLQESGVALLDECLGVDPGRPDMDVCVGTDVIAAAEVVAALAGRPAADFPSQLSPWVAKHRSIEPSRYSERAVALLDVVLSERSELRRLWEENQELYGEWRQRVVDLKQRLAG